MILKRKDLDKAVERAKEHEKFCAKYHPQDKGIKCGMPGCQDSKLLIVLAESFEKALVVLEKVEKRIDFAHDTLKEIGISSKKDIW